jgi:hypothetical protein
MTNYDATRAVIDKLGDQPGETLTPERVEAIQTAMHEDLGRFIHNTSYFVLGSYGEEERPRLEAVRDQLASDAAASNSDDGVDAFLMDDILDVSTFSGCRASTNEYRSNQTEFEMFSQRCYALVAD